MSNNQSEVHRLLEQIEQEYQSACSALDGYTPTARHTFITARMERMGKVHAELQQMVGEHAIRLIAERLETLSE